MCFSTSPSIVCSCSCFYCFYCSADTSYSSDTKQWYPFEICGWWGTEEANIASSGHACPPWYCPSLKHCVVCKDKRIRNKTHPFLLLQVGRSPSLPLCFSPSPAGRPHWCSSSVTTHFVLILAPAQPSQPTNQAPSRPSTRVSYSTALSIFLQSTGTSLYPTATNPFCCVYTLQHYDNCPMRWVLGDAKKCFIRPD